MSNNSYISPLKNLLECNDSTNLLDEKYGKFYSDYSDLDYLLERLFQNRKDLIKKIPYYEFRNLVRPGISGWAQVNYPYGASVSDTVNKLSFDIYYISNFSLLLDLLILFKTIKVVLTGKGHKPNN